MASVRSVVVVGASAGGVEALTSFIGALPEELPAAVLVVLHVAPGGTSVLPGILDRAGLLSARPVVDGERLEEGRIYVAAPDRHLVIEDGAVRMPLGPRENGHRPAVDPLFRSAAATFGSGVVAVVLSGSRDDGTAGAAAVKAAGGRVVVQEPGDALYASMPQSVLDHVVTDGRAEAAELGRLVGRWAVNGGRAMSGAGEDDDAVLERHAAGEAGASGLTCPECGGAVYLDVPNGVAQLSCHTGHAYSLESFAAEQQRTLEGALWSAVRRLDERAALLDSLTARFGENTALRFRGLAEEARSQADVIRGLIARQTPEPA